MLEPAAVPQSFPAFLSGGGAMGDAIRAHDWSATPLGPPEGWPPTLQVLVGTMLASHQPMFIAWGAERTMIYNDAYVPLLDRRHPAALGAGWATVWHDVLPEVEPILDRAFAGEPVMIEEIALMLDRGDGPQEAHFAFSYTPLHATGSDAVDGVLCICAEITELAIGEQQRRADTERLQQLFLAAPNFMAVSRGPDHVFEMANEAYRQLVGHRDLIGRPVREAFPDVEGQGLFELLDHVFRTGKAYTGRGRRLSLQTHPDASPTEVVLDFVYQPIRDAAGNVSGIFLTGNDVTDRHQAVARLEESEERFRLIADSAPVPIWVTKLDRTRSFVNQAYVAFVGAEGDAALTFDWRAILHPDDQDRIVAESVAGEATLKPFTLEARYRRGDGLWRWIRSTSSPRWGPDGEHAGFIGVAHDVTEAKEAETALRELNETLERRVEERTADLSAALERLQQEVIERERAEEALRQAQKMEAVGQLTGGIAHDFNNLLTPIIGGLDLVARRLDDPKLQRIAQGALDSAHRGAKLATQLLAFSRLQRLAMEPVPVNHVIEEMGRILHHTIGPKIEIRQKLDPAVGRALCDSNQLENAILNLAINARDAMPDGGCLTISTGLMDAPDGPDLAAGTYVCVCVSDTGQGMPPHVLARAMEPFFSTKPTGKGTGLGLAQVYGIAHQSGGTVRIDSEEGRGTRVRLLLRKVQADAPGDRHPPAPAETASAPEAQPAEILVIDDDPDVRNFLVHALVELGHRVHACESGESGLERLKHAAPDLVLIDFAMPGMDGAQLAREIRAAQPEQRIAFVTGYAESDRIEAAVGKDVPVLRKPFSMTALADLIAQSEAPAG